MPVQIKHKNGEYHSLEEVLEVARQAEGLSFNDIDTEDFLKNEKNKGALGQIIEVCVFGLDVNNNVNPDFWPLRLELKVTPVKLDRRKKRYKAKERLVLGMINYVQEALVKFFEDSHAWHKAKNLLIFFYLWQEDKERGEYRILKAFVHSFSEEELVLIRDDWRKIHDLMAAGRAEDITEGMTTILGACTKGSSGKDLREQYGSAVRVRPRAYCLSTRYMDVLANRVLGSPEKIPQIFADGEIKRFGSYAEAFRNKLEPFVGLTTSEIAPIVGYEKDSKTGKQRWAQLAAAMLGVKGMNLNDTKEFQESGIHVKTVRLEPNGVPKESMSFGVLDFDDFLNKEWEDSQIFREFYENKYLLVVYQYRETEKENPNRDAVFCGARLWHMPGSILDTYVKKMWSDTKALLEHGVTLKKNKNGSVSNNLPKKSDNPVVHLRPKGRNGKDYCVLPNKQKIVKQSFWLNNTYIASVLKEKADNRFVRDVVLLNDDLA